MRGCKKGWKAGGGTEEKRGEEQKGWCERKGEEERGKD